jgi:hypothetical protein
MKLDFNRHVFEKFSNIKFYKNPASGRRVVPCVGTDMEQDRHDEANSFRNFADVPKDADAVFHVLLF